MPLQRLRRRLWRYGRWWYFLIFQRRRHRALVLEWIHGHPFVILPDVFNPAIFTSGVFLAEQLEDLHGKRVLDMGTGSGIGAIFAAINGANVTAADINPQAVRCVRINALLNRVESQIDAIESDLFAALHGQLFDLILFNPPFYQGQPRDQYDQAWRGVDVVRRFANELPTMLTSKGYGLCVLSTDGDTSVFLEMFEDAGLHIEVFAVRDIGHEVLTIYKLTTRGQVSR